MKCDTLANYGKKISYEKNYFKRINFADDKVTRLLDGISNSHKKQIIETLNKINNQNIQDINFDKYQYTHRDNILGFSKLSKAESVFLVASVADIKKTNVWLHTDITQLTRSTLIKFMKQFKNSPYINIIYDSELSRAFYNSALKEATND